MAYLSTDPNAGLEGGYGYNAGIEQPVSGAGVPMPGGSGSGGFENGGITGGAPYQAWRNSPEGQQYGGMIKAGMNPNDPADVARWQQQSGGGSLPQVQHGANGEISPTQYAAGGTAQGGGSVESILRGIDPNNWEAGLAQHEQELNALGVTLQKGSGGNVRGRLYMPSSNGDPYSNPYDPFSQYGWKTNGGGGGGSLGSVGSGGFYGSMMNRVPTAEEAGNMPGIQFALQEGQKGIERSAAAKGTLLTGGTLKDLAGYTTGAALSQGYLPLANLRNSTNQANVGNLFNLAQLGQNASSYSATGRPA